MKNESIKGKRILITGINGFIGSHLAKALKKEGAIVYGLSRSAPKSGRNLRANILNYRLLSDFIRENKIQICFHLAAESIVEAGQKDPYNTFRSNIQGTLNILESSRQNNLEKVIIASTSHVYGKNRVPYYEGYTPRPSRPYETSKTTTDLIAQSYADTFGLPVLIPRFANIYGPGDTNFTRLIPKTIKRVFESKSPEMWGGAAIRDYLYIDDAINAYLLLAQLSNDNMDKNRIFNFGTGNSVSVEHIIKKITRISGKDLKIKRVKEGREGEIKIQYVSFKKASKFLQWEPKMELDEGLGKAISWYNEYLSKS